MKFALDRRPPTLCMLLAAPVMPLLINPSATLAQVTTVSPGLDPYKSGPTRPLDGSQRSGVYAAAPAPRYYQTPERVGATSSMYSGPAIWRGLYGGILAGHRWSSAQNDAFGLGALKIGGWQIGGLVGQNFQTGNVVYGLESDVVLGRQVGSLTQGSTSLTYRDSWSSSVRGRLGLTGSSTMLYATGGIAFSGQELTVSAPPVSGSLGALRVGWVAGAGIETQLAPQVSARVEGLHYVWRDGAFSSGTATQTIKTDSTTLRGALIYRFN